MTRVMLAPDAIEDIDNEDRVKVLGIIDQFRALGVNEDVSLPQVRQVSVYLYTDTTSSWLLETSLAVNLLCWKDSLVLAFQSQVSFARDLQRKLSLDELLRVMMKYGYLLFPDRQLATTRIRSVILRVLHALYQVKILIARGSKRFSMRYVFATVVSHELISQAATHMGLPASSTENLADLEKRFSDDILRIEISGPTHHHLSVVDVPGLFHNPTRFQTEEDLEIIRNLLQGYITDSRTIILYVCIGNCW